jgi:hypothetical protein
MIIEASANEYRVFSCMKCGAEHCRKCNRPWNKMHIGKACHEMLTEQEKLNALYVLFLFINSSIFIISTRIHKNATISFSEIKLSEAIIRRCHRCSLPFVKIEGCNRMQCRCGATQVQFLLVLDKQERFFQCYLCRAVNINYPHFCQYIIIFSSA